MASNSLTFANKKPAEIERMLDVYAPQLQKVLIGTGIDPRRYARMAVSLLMGNPGLAECEQTSVFRSLMTAAQLGLEPDNVLGQVYLVPFKEWGIKKAQVIVGYKGYIRLADNAGWSIKAETVRQADDFDWAEGTESYIKHKPSSEPASEANTITHVYAIATHRATGYKEFVVMPIADVHAIRDRSEGYQYAAKNNKKTPWIGPDYEWMVKKTAIRQIAPRLPVQVQKAAMIDAMADQGKTIEIDPDSGALKDVSPNTSANQPDTLKGMEEDAAPVAAEVDQGPGPREAMDVTPGRDEEFPL